MSVLQPKSRPPLERMVRIHHEIASGSYPNASTMARELEVSAKSIQRDLEFMRDRLNLPLEYDGTRLGYKSVGVSRDRPLEYDGSRFGYYYTEPVSSFPTLQITEGELVALL